MDTHKLKQSVLALLAAALLVTPASATADAPRRSSVLTVRLGTVRLARGVVVAVRPGRGVTVTSVPRQRLGGLRLYVRDTQLELAAGRAARLGRRRITARATGCIKRSCRRK